MESSHGSVRHSVASPVLRVLSSPPASNDKSRAEHLRTASRGASVVAIVVGCLVLLGWGLDVSVLKSVRPSLATMKANAALAFVLAGGALWNSQEPARGQRARRIAIVCAMTVTLIGVLTLFEYSTRWDLGIDQLLVNDDPLALYTAWPGRMAIATASSFVFLGLALLLIDVPLQTLRPSNWLTLAGAFMALLPLVGHLYGVRVLYQMAAFTTIAVHTAFTLLVLYLGVLFARPERGMMAVVTSRTPGGEMARRLFPAVIVLPIAIGWLGLEGQRAGLYDTEFGLALFACSTIVCFTWWTTRAIVGSESKREKALHALAVREAQLTSERRLRSMTDAAHDAIVAADPDGAIIGFNHGAEMMFGYEEVEALGKSLTVLMPERYREAHRADTERARAMGQMPGGGSVEAHCLQKDGTEFTCELSVSTWETVEGTFSTRIIRDITDRKKAEEALRRSEEKYRLIIETTHEAVCISDAEGRYTFVNARMGKMLGYEPSELLGKSMFDLMDAEGIVFAKRLLEQRHKLQPESGELRGKHKGGADVWVLFESTPIVDDGRYAGTLSMLVDVTERKEMERALRDREASLAVTLDSIADGVIATDREGHVVRMNPVAERLLGMTGRAALGKRLGDIFRIVHETTRAPVESPVERALKEGVAVGLASGAVLVRGDGSEVPIADSCSPIRDASGEIAGAVLVFRDVSDERSLRRAKEKLQSQLMFEDRMTSMGTLAAGVGHEINNPLASVMANLELLAEELRRGDPSAWATELGEMVGEAREGADRVRKIVRGLKTFSRIETGQQQPLDLNLILESALALSSHEIKLRARLAEDYGDIPVVLGDEGRIGKVFINLLVNAAQALPEGQADRAEVRVTTRKAPDGRAVVEVRDTGPGIPPHLLSRIFDPFFTTKPVGAGTGLGLSICHGIVTGHGGELTVESEVGKGSTFRVVLPAAPALRAKSTRPPERSGCILVVDDEEMVGSALRKVLRPHTITVAKNGREALAMLTAGARFDLVLCDLMMPEMTGMALHAELSRALPDVIARMVFMTGGAFSRGARAFLDEIPNERVEKPFDLRDLRALVQRFVQ